MAKLPRHIAIVMDGNGRWAIRRSLARAAGHESGARVVRDIVQYAAERRIEVLTLFAFSLENRLRPASEVNFLMRLFLRALQENTAKLHENNIRLRIIGDYRQFDSAWRQQAKASQDLTQANDGLTLVIAIHYSGRWDITQAASQLCAAVQRGDIQRDSITPAIFERYLTLSDMPDPDLLIRTSGEQRLSNFMLWQFAYTEIYFTPLCWPEFDRKAFDDALAFYQRRKRRFGRIPEQMEQEYA